jgi:hypothetical protein
MICYRLRCEAGHEFEAWFRSSAGYDEQAERGLLSCAACGTPKVEKALMAPNVAKPAEDRAERVPSALAPAKLPVASQLPPPMLEMLKKFREHVKETSDYVGDKFAEEARRIHYDEAEARGIYGEATAAEARELHEEGIQVHALPALPDDAN